MDVEGENVIYVQVDENGRVINYTTNMPGGEQVILLQEGGDDGSQQVLYQPEQLLSQQTATAVTTDPSPQQQIITDMGTNVMQDTSTAYIATDQNAQIQQQGISTDQQGQQTAVMMENNTLQNTGSTIIEAAYSQATQQAPPTSNQTAILDQSGNQILVTDESQIPMHLMASNSSSGPIILSNEQAQVLIAGTSPRIQTSNIRGKIRQNVTPSRSLISQATRSLLASQRGTTPVRSLPAALQPARQTIITSQSTLPTAVQVSKPIIKAGATTLVTSLSNIQEPVDIQQPEVSSQPNSEEVVRLEDAQKISELSGGDSLSQEEKDMLEAARIEQEKQNDTPQQAPVASDETNKNNSDDNRSQSLVNTETNIKEISSSIEVASSLTDDLNIPVPNEECTNTEQNVNISKNETAVSTAQEMETNSFKEPEKVTEEEEHLKLPMPVVSDPIIAAVDPTAGATGETTVVDGQALQQLMMADDEMEVQQPEKQSTEGLTLNGNIFQEEKIPETKQPEPVQNTKEQLQSKSDSKAGTVQITIKSAVQMVPAEEPSKSDATKDKEDIDTTYAKIMELSDKFDNKYAEITGFKSNSSKNTNIEGETKNSAAILNVQRESTIVSKDAQEDHDDCNELNNELLDTQEQQQEDETKNVDSDEELQFKPRGVGRPKKTYEGIARKRQNTENEDKTLDQSIAERRARRKTKPVARDIDMISEPLLEDDSDDEGYIIENQSSMEKRGRGRPRKIVNDSSPPVSPQANTSSNGEIGNRIIEEQETPKTSNKSADLVSSEKRGRGRPRKSESSPANSQEQQPDVTSSSDNNNDADPAQKTFMANFSLMTAAQRAAQEEENKRRKSKRVTLAEQRAQKEEDSQKKSDNIFDIFDSPSKKIDPFALNDDDTSSPVLPKLSGNNETDVRTLQSKISKLQTVNAELKSRLRAYESKSASNKFAERNEIKSLQAKVEKLNTQNTDLKCKVNDLEMSRTSVPQTVDKKGVVHKMKSPKASRLSMGKSDKNAMNSHDYEEWEAELKCRAEALDKKETKLKILDRELDERTAVLKAKEGQQGRCMQVLKGKEKELEYREKQLERSQHQLNSDGKVKENKLHQLELREASVDEKEKDLEHREKLLTTTEKQLQALGEELKEKFDYLQSNGQDVSKAKSELEASMAVSAAKVRATTSAFNKISSLETSRITPKRRGESPASSRGSVESSRIVRRQRQDSSRSNTSKVSTDEKVPTKSRRSVIRPKKYSPSPDPEKIKAAKESIVKPKEKNPSKDLKSEKKSSKDLKTASSTKTVKRVNTSKIEHKKKTLSLSQANKLKSKAKNIRQGNTNIKRPLKNNSPEKKNPKSPKVDGKKHKNADKKGSSGKVIGTIIFMDKNKNKGSSEGSSAKLGKRTRNSLAVQPNKRRKV